MRPPILVLILMLAITVIAFRAHAVPSGLSAGGAKRCMLATRWSAQWGKCVAVRPARFE